MHLFGLRTVALLIAAAVAFAWEGTARAAEAPATRLEFASGGRRIAVDRYAPAGGKGRAAILVLHGAGGTLFDGPAMRRVARRLAAQGDEAYFVHYFNRTGTFFGRDKNMQAHFEQWLATVRDAVAWVQRTRGSDAPVGIFGYSLGAFLAVAAASDNPRVGAVVEQSGGIWNNRAERIGRLPPTLMIHGRHDQRVPFAKYAGPLRAVAKRRGADFQTRDYLDEGHVFSGAAAAQVRAQAARWFADHPGLRSSQRKVSRS